MINKIIELDEAIVNFAIKNTYKLFFMYFFSVFSYLALEVVFGNRAMVEGMPLNSLTVIEFFMMLVWFWMVIPMSIFMPLFIGYLIITRLIFWSIYGFCVAVRKFLF